jgi:hypothetical protein
MDDGGRRDGERVAPREQLHVLRKLPRTDEAGGDMAQHLVRVG